MDETRGHDVLEVAKQLDAVRHSGEGAAKPPRVGYLDGWRGCAILVVLLGHFGGAHLEALGSVGVELFFVLSGRLMAGILFGERFPIGPFLYRRVTRIWPVVMLFTGVVVLTKIVYPSLVSTTGVQIASAATFTYNYLDAFVGRGGAVDHMWSICVEEHCYLLLAFIAVLTGRRAAAAGPLILILALAAMLNGIVEYVVLRPEDARLLFWRTDVRGASILLPVALYLLGWPSRKVPQGISLGLIAAGFALALGPWAIATTLGTAALAFAIWHIGTVPALVWFLQTRALAWIGRCSFSIYVWQQPFYRYVYLNQDALRHMPMIKRLSIQGGILGAALACGLLSFYLFENPVRRALNSRPAARV